MIDKQILISLSLSCRKVAEEHISLSGIGDINPTALAILGQPYIGRSAVILTWVMSSVLVGSYDVIVQKAGLRGINIIQTCTRR